MQTTNKSLLTFILIAVIVLSLALTVFLLLTPSTIPATESPLFWLVAMTPLFVTFALIQWRWAQVFQPHPLTPSPSVGTRNGASDEKQPHPIAPSPNGEGETSAASGGEAKRFTFTELAIVTIGFAVLIIALWIPFGLNGNAAGETWEYRGWIEANVFPFMHAPISPQRPFTFINEWLSYVITPDSFVGLNALMIFYLISKGVMLWALIRRLLPAYTGLALAVAVIFTLFPIEQFYYMGAISLQTSMFLLLIGAHLLLTTWRKPSPLLFIAASIFALCAYATYEVALPFVILLPVALLLDTPRLSRRWFAVALMWAILPLLWIGYFVLWLLTSPSQYFAQQAQAAQIVDVSVPRALVQVYYNALIGLLIPVGRAVWNGVRSLEMPAILGAVGVVIAALVGWRVIRVDKDLPIRRAIALIVAGLVIIGVGVIMYTPSRAFTGYAYYGSYTYYVSILGAALIFGTVIVLLLPNRWWQTVVIALVAGVLVINLVRQHQISRVNTADQSAALARIVSAIPHITPGTNILVLDESSDQAVGGYFYHWVLDGAMRVIYDESDLRTRKCDLRVTAESEAINALSAYWCAFTPEGVNVRGYEINHDVEPYSFYRGERELFPYDQLVIVHHTDEGTRLLDAIPPEWIETDAYQPLARVDLSAPLPPRYESMLVPALRFAANQD